MFLVCDENISPQLVDAIEQTGYQARSFDSLGLLGVPDVIWLPLVGHMEEAVVLSRDLNLVRKQRERRVFIDNRFAAILLTGGQSYADRVAELVLGNLTGIEEIYLNTPRPFVRFLLPNGQFSEEYRGYSLF